MKTRISSLLNTPLLLASVILFTSNSVLADDFYDDFGMPYGQMGMMGQGGHMGFGRMMGGEHMGFGMMSMLNLSDDQQKKANQLQDNMRKKQWEKRGEIMELQAKLRDEFQKDKPNPKEVGNIYEKIAQIRKSMIEERVASMNKLNDLLDDKQREMVKANPGFGRGPGPMMGRGWRYTMDD